MLYKIYYIDHLVEMFFQNFNRHYADALATDFTTLSLPEQVDYVKHLYKVCANAFMFVCLFVCLLLFMNVFSGDARQVGGTHLQ